MNEYKILLPGGITPFRKTKWPVKIGQWTPKIQHIKMRESGWHLCTENSLSQLLKVGDLFLAKGRGDSILRTDKNVYQEVKLVKKLAAISINDLAILAAKYSDHVKHLQYTGCDAARDAAANAAYAAYAAAYAARAAYAAAAAANAARAAYAAAAYARDAAANAARAAAYAAYAAAYAADAAAEKQWQHDTIIEYLTNK